TASRGASCRRRAGDVASRFRWAHAGARTGTYAPRCVYATTASCLDSRRARVLYSDGHSIRMEGDIVGAAQMFIDGKWTAATSGKTYDVPNPATEETIGSAPDAGVEDLQRAIAAARKAFDEGPWPRSTRHERYRA